MSTANNGHSSNPDREQRILAAAADLIAHYGYNKTTMNEIAQAAGVSKGALYLHWKSKEDLFEALLQREIQHYLDDWMALLERDPNGGTFFGLYMGSLAVLKDYPFLLALIRQDKRMLGEYMMNKNPQMYTRRMALGEDLIRMMQASGMVRADVDPPVMSYILSLVRYGYLTVDEVIPPEDAPPTMPVLEELFKMLTAAFAPPDGGDSEAGKQMIRQMIERIKQELNKGVF